MPKRGLEAAQGQRDARSDSRRPDRTGATPRPVHGLMVAACIEVLEWPDIWLAHDLYFGMHAAGNRSESEPGMRDTGVFRAHARPAAYSLADLCAGNARPLRSRLIEYGGHQTWLREPGPALMSSAAWFIHLQQLCKTRADKALAKAGVSADEIDGCRS